jgi:NAD(P)-dependent dehydrogenase (short-subunit alcohol dehydrogenase family)
MTTGAKTIIVTGANRGVGRATAERLVREGHRVLITARDFTKGERAASEIRAAVAVAQVEARRLDLASFQSVRDFAGGILCEGLAVDVLLHNAGVLTPSKTRRMTIDGIEDVLGVNVLGPFLLTRELLPALERSAGARVVCVSSRLHLPGGPDAPARFDFGDPQQTRDYRAGRAYRNSKLALVWFTYELQRRLPPRRITANAMPWLRADDRRRRCDRLFAADAALCASAHAVHDLGRHRLA